MHNLSELKIWNKAIDLGVEVYKVISKFPADERFGLSSQIKRAAVSISANIAEGAGRNSNNEFVHFLGIANGSAYELLSHLVISNKLELIKETDLKLLTGQLEEIQKMNYSFQKLLKEKSQI